MLRFHSSFAFVKARLKGKISPPQLCFLKLDYDGIGFKLAELRKINLNIR